MSNLYYLDFIFLGLGLAIGFGAGWISCRSRGRVNREAATEEANALRRELEAIRIDYAKLSERLTLAEERYGKDSEEFTQERQFNISLHAELSRERTTRVHLEGKIEQQKSEMLQLQERLSRDFSNLVRQTLDEQTSTLTDENKARLAPLIQPIVDQLREFQQTTEQQHNRETHELLVLHNKLANLEAKRWPEANGSVRKADEHEETNGTPTLGPNDLIEFVNVPLESAFAQMPENGDESPLVSDLGDPEKRQDSFHPFTPKQEVEINNFLKRTIHRATRKKPTA